MCPHGSVYPGWASKDCTSWVGGSGGGGASNGGVLEPGRWVVRSDASRPPAGGADGIFFRPAEEIQPPEPGLLASLLRAMKASRKQLV